MSVIIHFIFISPICYFKELTFKDYEVQPVFFNFFFITFKDFKPVFFNFFFFCKICRLLIHLILVFSLQEPGFICLLEFCYVSENTAFNVLSSVLFLVKVLR